MKSISPNKLKAMQNESSLNLLTDLQSNLETRKSTHAVGSAWQAVDQRASSS